MPRRGADWLMWSRRVRVDLAAARAFASAVYDAGDDYLVPLDPEALDRAPSASVSGDQTLAWLLNNMLAQHAALHSGEIAVLRGLQGLQGLP